ncbi:MAG: DNA-protecting protein DprA [Polaromonas sp.]|nr:DNA-protecting protein DprA [Polaromonas sp.]
MERTELKAWLRLTLSPGVGNNTVRKLLAAFGSAEAVFEQSEAALRQLGSGRLVEAITTEPPKLAELLQATTDWLAGGDDRAVAPIGSALYPEALLNIEDPPLVLYMMGSQLNKAQTAINSIATNLAIVGSRNPTPQGEQNARQFAKAFAEQGLCIVSGLALGVDGAAHDGALLGGGSTIAVVGTGLDRVYPKKHLTLAHRIAANGLIISEFPIGTPPLNANFPKRNRIISGLSSGTLVVEAALKSGSLITARLASEQGKDVFAIPGSIHSPQSRGCHYLIKQGAKLVETAQDVMEELRIPLSLIAQLAEDDDEAPEGFTSSSPEGDSLFLSALGFDIVSLDALQARCGLPTPELQAKLLELELDGFVMRLPGGLFQRMAAG